MRNKSYKRRAKRLKGQADELYECVFCKLQSEECYCACCTGIRNLEMKIKDSKKLINSKENINYKLVKSKNRDYKFQDVEMRDLSQLARILSHFSAE